MGMFDDIKGKAEELIGSHKDESKAGVDKAGDLVDERTGGQYAGQVDQAQAKADEIIEGIDNQ